MTLPRQTLRLTVHELADALDVNKLYGDGIRQEAPQALQVVDRFHLVKNRRQATEAFLHNQRPGRFRPRRRAPPRRSPVWPVYGVNNYHLMVCVMHWVSAMPGMAWRTAHKNVARTHTP